MHIGQVIEQMKHMRLTSMAESFQSLLDSSESQDLGHEEFVGLLIDAEYTARHNRKLNRMIGRANLKPEQACIANIHYSANRGFAKKDIAIFQSNTWLKNTQNILIVGPTGCGKTYLAEAIAFQALRMGFSAIKIRYRMLFEEIHSAKGTGTYLKFLKKIAAVKVLIIDDFVMNAISENDAGELLDIIEEKEQTGSVIITSQFPIDKWYLKLPDPTIADAICDRLINASYKLNLKGESMRQKRQKSQVK